MAKPAREANDPLAELAAKAALAGGRDAAKRAAERAAERADDALGGARSPKARKYKLLALVVLGLFLTIGVVGFVLHYWAWFLAAGALGVAALVAYVWARRRLAARRAARETVADAPARAVVSEPPAAAQRVKLERGGRDERVQREAREAEHEADREARAEAEHERAEAEERAAREIDDELAKMRARLRK